MLYHSEYVARLIPSLVSARIRTCNEAARASSGALLPVIRNSTFDAVQLLTFIATPPYRGWQRSEGLLLLHSFPSLDIFVAFSILRFDASAKSVS